ncbi:structure-specific endonuclease subunit SLX4 [Chaetomium tenue]|uniref:Structure-specific endonuclease subunit SLX4 n=1 Tax=Chaetomium tenue TaxID=1854479 RepID=A0ACB7PT92_9PEZI|nr:structure-specific endonuclease subunit SLX4 [Chaetomium globosum]
MATGGLLSSSPVKMAHHDSVLVISSSPDFPSICDLLPKAIRQPSLRSGSNAAPVPNDAPAAFTSATNIWQSSRALQHEGPAISKIGPSQGATPADLPTVPAESPIQSGVEGPTLQLGGEKRKPRTAGARKKKGKTETTERPLALDMAVADGPAAVAAPKKSGRKPRATKDATLAQTTLPKGKVTKAAAKETTKAQKKAETVSRHFAPHTSAPAAPPELVAGPIAGPMDDSPSIFEPAMARRMDWTPPRESATVHCLADSSTEKAVSSSALPLQDNVFKTLQDTYGRAIEAGGHVGAPLPLANTDVLGKRKLVEMVAYAGHRQETPQASPTKPKVVKKKPRTITELATAAYRRPEEEERSTSSMQQDTHTPSGNPELPGEQLTAASKSASAKSKAAKKAPKPRATKKKQPPPEPILLSPTSAMRQVSKQDFVFGTASQLATEDDPVLLRALHEAMKVSNQADSDPFATPSPGNGNLAIRRRPGAGLWAAGARYGDGDLLDAEVLDLTRSSPLTLAQLTQNPPRPCPEAVLAHKPPVETAYIEIEMSDDTLDLSISPPVGWPKTLPPCPPRPGSQAVQHEDSNLAVNGRPQTPPQEPDFDPPPSNQEQHQLLLSQSNTPQQLQPAPPPPPSFELYTDARLAKEVASYGFKVVKKRTGMIALLNRCWESQNKTALGSTATQAAMSTSAANQAASPSRPRGRPRKDSLTAATEVVQAPSPAKKGRKKAGVVSDAGSEAPQPEKRPRGRPRKDSAASVSSIAASAVTKPRRRSAAISNVESDEPPVEKRPRGRPKKDAATSPAKRTTKAKGPASPKRAKSPRSTQPAPTTPPRRKAPAKQILEIPDSESDDPFASSAPSSPDQHSDLFSSPPAVDLSVTEDTEPSLIAASPTTQDLSLFGYITRAVVSAPPTNDPANPSWHEKMLMYDPIILEDLTAWLNAGRLDQVGFDGEVAPVDVKKWCESKSVCCLWRVNLRGKERKRF